MWRKTISKHEMNQYDTTFVLQWAGAKRDSGNLVHVVPFLRDALYRDILFRNTAVLVLLGCTRSCDSLEGLVPKAPAVKSCCLFFILGRH